MVKRKASRYVRSMGKLLLLPMLAVAPVVAQAGHSANKAATATPKHPKLIVMLVVDQFRADYVDKFRGQWSGGFKRLLDEGAWFRQAAYPYAATETCVGHATISTGALPITHGMVANAWWDRDTQAQVTCTADPKAKNIAYAGGTTKGGDSAWRMLAPSFAEELKLQQGGATRIVTFSLKARSSITMAGHKADAVTWFDTATGSWTTSSVYGAMPFVDEFAKAHPVVQDYGKTWALSLPADRYFFAEPAVGAETLEGWETTFPHELKGKEGGTTADASFYYQWNTSPFADTYLTRMAESAVDSLGLGKGGGTDYLGVSYSSVDYVGHAFGPRSWEIQDMLVRLDKDLAELFTYLDEKVGNGNYVVAVTGDHGVSPTLPDLVQTGFNVGMVSVPALKEKIEKELEPLHLTSPAIARITGEQVYFAPGVYQQLQQNPPLLQSVVDAAASVPGIAAVFASDELKHGTKTLQSLREAVEFSYFRARSGDLYLVQRPYWEFGDGKETAATTNGASHGTPYFYDQRVPILMMGFGVKPGEYWQEATPADLAPTFAAMTGITLAIHDGRVLTEALLK